MTTTLWPRLSEDLPGVRHLYRCQSCEITANVGMSLWQEHGDNDDPEPIVISLCNGCADRLIEAHPRLYRRLSRNEPFPGAMRICLDCVWRDKLGCLCSESRWNGGPGLKFPGPDSTVFVDGIRNGRRFGEQRREWSQEPTTCEGKATVEEMG